MSTREALHQAVCVGTSVSPISAAKHCVFTAVFRFEGQRWRGSGAARLLLGAALLAVRRAAPPARPAPPAPCATAPLCLCTDDRFTCDSVLFHRFPETGAGVRHVSVWGARLGVLDEAALDARALDTLVLVACRLDVLHPAALASMHSSLASLDLGHNEFTEVPLAALRHLKVLNWLNLQNNFVSELDPAVEWGGLAESLTSLSLSNNRLTWVQAGALRQLRALTQLELDGNRLLAVDAGALPGSLLLLRLSDNLLRAPPCAMLAALSRLQHLALRDNFLTAPTSPGCHSPPDTRSHDHLHTLDLAHNSLDDDFRLELGIRLQLKHLLLDLNDLTMLPAFVLECGRLEKLSVSHNRLSVVPEAALRTLAHDLRELDLDYNELGALPGAMRGLVHLRRLSVAYNRLREVPILPPRVSSLSLAGNALGEFPVGLLGVEPGALVHLDLGYNRIAHVSAGDFGAWAATLETLSLRGNRLAALTSGAFPVLPLRELALSFNELFSLDVGALAPLRSLAVLELSGALASGALPRTPPGVAWLTLDNNDIRRVAAVDLLVQPDLLHLNLDFNKIEEFPSDPGRVNVSMKLRELRLAYNYVHSVNGEFLSGLKDLQSVDLSYNRMTNVSEMTFARLKNLAFVGLAGNVIEYVAPSAFSVLPRLQTLELQHNRLEWLSIDSFDLVSGDESNLSINVSHNNISALRRGGSVPVSVLDLSFNALENISGEFFESIASHLRHLLLAHNRLVVLESLGGPLPKLAVLSLRGNALEAVRRRALAAAPALEELDLARNRLATLQPDQFRALRRLRALRLAGNQLRVVPPGAFAGTLLEAIDIRDNRLSGPPSGAVAGVGFTLRRLELGGNALTRLDAAALAGTGFLRELGLTRTALRVVPDAALAGLPHLRRLDLSHNALVANYRELLHPVPRLRRLSLAGAGLRAIPSLPLPDLRELDLSGNVITACRESDVRAFPELRALNLSLNRLTALHPAAWSVVPHLAVLDVAHNPIARAGDALEGLARLLRLHMHGLLALEPLDRSAFRSLHALRSLSLDVGRRAAGAALEGVPQLQALTLHVRAAVLDDQLVGLDAAKLRAVELRGPALRALTARALAPLGRARALTLRLRGTRVAALPAGLAARLARVPALALELSGNAVAALTPAALYPNLTGWNRRATKVLSGGLVVQEAGVRCGCGAAWLGAWLRRWTREVGGGARDALWAARESWCAGRGGARAPLLAQESDGAECRARALSSRAARRPRVPTAVAAGLLLLLTRACS